MVCRDARGVSGSVHFGRFVNVARFQHVINDFSAGVLSPRLTIRGDVDRFPSALSEGINFIVSPQGGSVYREGFEFIGRPFADEPFRVFTFHRGGDVSDVLIEVTAGKLRYWIDDELVVEEEEVILADEADGEELTDEADGQFLIDGDPEMSDNPYEPDELSSLYFSNQEQFGVFTHEAHPPAYVRVSITGNITFEALPFNAIPFTSFNDEKSPTAISGQAVYNIVFENYSANDRYTIRYDQIFATVPFPEPTPIQFTFGTDSEQQSSIRIGLEAISATPTVDPVTVTTPLTEYQVVLDGPNAGQVMNFITVFSLLETANVSITNTGLVNFGREPAWSFPYVVLNNAIYWQCIKPHTSTAANEPGVGVDSDEFWLDIGAIAPDWWEYQHNSANDWQLDQNYSPWDRGFPRTNVFHEQRLILGGSSDASTTIWGSRIGVYDDFIGGVNDDDPFEFSLDTSDTPQIKWMQSQLNLMIGTSSGDWNISSQVTLTPTDIQAIKQNNARSHQARPIAIDTEIFYIEQGQTKLRATRYVRDYNAFTSVDASLLSESLLYDGLRTIHVQHVPEILITMVSDDDSQIRFLTYEKNTQSAAWTQLETEGEIFDATVYFTTVENTFSRKGNDDVVYVAIERRNGWMLEKMPYPARDFAVGVPLNVQGVCHLDSWIDGVVDGFPEGDGVTIEGLDHLEGEFVEVLIDDAIQTGEFVVENGTITLEEDSTGAQYAVGIPYPGLMKTFEVELDPVTTGYGAKRQWNSLTLRLLDSALPLIGGPLGVGQLPPDRTPATPMGEPETYRPGLQDVNIMQLGYADGSVEIRSAGPYPLHILGFFGEFSTKTRGGP